MGKPEIVTILSRDPGPPPISYITRSGGLFRDMMIHDLDMARFLLGEEPVEVSAMAACLVDPAIGQAGDIDTAVVTLKTKSGKLAQISNSRRATYGYDQRIEVHGSGGLLRADNQFATTVQKANGDGFSSDPVLNFFLERYTPAYRAEMDTFVTGVLENKPLAPTGEDGLKALVLADAAEKSAKTGPEREGRVGPHLHIVIPAKRSASRDPCDLSALRTLRMGPGSSAGMTVRVTACDALRYLPCRPQRHHQRLREAHRRSERAEIVHGGILDDRTPRRIAR